MIAVLAACLGGASSAQAGTLVITVNDAGQFVADPGETNFLTYSRAGNQVTYADTGATITVFSDPANNCTGDGTNSVTCTVVATNAGTPSISLGDMGDTGVVGTTPPGPSTFDAVADIHGEDGGDTLLGDAQRDILQGGDGADIIQGFGGRDDLDGGLGADEVHGMDGADSVAGGGGSVDQLFGEDGDDFFTDSDDSVGDADFVNGGNGHDSISSYGQRTTNLIIDLAAGTVAPEGDTLTPNSIEDVFGGSGNDNITGSSAFNFLSGNIGNDTIFGGGDTDSIEGDEGNDILHGEAGDDFVDGGEGLDQLFGETEDDLLTDGDDEPDADSLDGGPGVDEVDSYRNRLGPVTVNLLTGTGNGVAGENDTLTAVENLSGSVFGDTITGSDSANELLGDPGGEQGDFFGGADTINGMGGSDAIFGGSRADVLTGGAGQDEIRGESGADTLNSADGGVRDQVGCGAGVDTVNGEVQDIVEADCETLNGGAVLGSGPQGPQGAQGPPGAQGPQGPVGRATCVAGKPKKKGKKVTVKITCTISPKVKAAQARLTRDGRTVARGSGVGSKVSLGGRKGLKRGRYVLTIGDGDDRRQMQVRIR